MRSLITGATGFLGGRLAERLLEQGENIGLFVRDPKRLSTGLTARCTVFSGDLGDLASLEAAVADATVIYHCAANVNTWDTTEAYHSANVAGVENLLKTVQKCNSKLKRLVHISTVDVYGYPELPCDERCPVDGGGFGYGESKLAGERLVREFGKTAGIPCTIIRPTNIMGPRSPFIARIGAELRNGLMLKIDGGRINAGIVDVDNLIDLLIWAAHADDAIGETYNMRDDFDVDWVDFLTDLRRRIDGHGFIVNLPYGLAMAVAKPLELLHRKLLERKEPLMHPLLVKMFGRTCGHSAEKIRQASGLCSQIDFEQSMQRSSAWFLKEQTEPRTPATPDVE